MVPPRWGSCKFCFIHYSSHDVNVGKKTKKKDANNVENYNVSCPVFNGPLYLHYLTKKAFSKIWKIWNSVYKFDEGFDVTERGQTKKIWLYQKLGLLEKLGLLGKLVYFVREPEQMVENTIYQLVSVKSI